VVVVAVQIPPSVHILGDAVQTVPVDEVLSGKSHSREVVVIQSVRYFGERLPVASQIEGCADARHDRVPRADVQAWQGGREAKAWKGVGEAKAPWRFRALIDMALASLHAPAHVQVQTFCRTPLI